MGEKQTQKTPKKKKKKTCGFVVGLAEDEAAMERGRVGGGKNVQASPDLAASCPPPTLLQASPDLELGAPEPHENRGPRRLRKLSGKGIGIRGLFPTFSGKSTGIIPKFSA